jgi:hypothetical protein
MTEATRSFPECAASDRTLTEEVIKPTITLRVTNVRLEMTEMPAAICFLLDFAFMICLNCFLLVFSEMSGRRGNTSKKVGGGFWSQGA